MRHVVALLSACALMIGSALTEQFPQTAPTGPTTVNAQNGVIPAGTKLTIRTNENIVADQSSAGRTYSAEIARDIVADNSHVLVPKGSPAELTVGKVGSGEMGVGSNEVALGLKSVTVNGHAYMVQTNQREAEDNRGIGANKRTAEMTGGGALLGTLIGAVAGGGKGAAIGAAVGGAAGATTQVMTRGHEVKVPAESVLTFKLEAPFTLQ